MLETGEPWTPIGANESVTWPDLAGLFRRRNLAGVEAYLHALHDRGVTVLRLMLEYCQGDHRFIERPVGHFVPAMVQLWDDLVAMCARVGMRILLTPFDTFFHWIRWDRHPYNRRNGGPCADRRQLLSCRDTRVRVKQRLAFATERWGGSGVLFAWDLWNELHPAQGGGDVEVLRDFVSDVSASLRETELRLHGRAHLQTVSVFGPELRTNPELRDIIHRHPALDFATTHFYADRTIDDPRDTVAPAVVTGVLVEQALAEIHDGRPFLDSEHGPIYRFKDRRETLPAEFDDEYFRHMQWAHVASGGAGGGMRWPNRHPHTLTPGMRDAQHSLARFLPLIDWAHFRRSPIGGELAMRDAISEVSLPTVATRAPARPELAPVVSRKVAVAAVFGCGDSSQALAYLIRADQRGSDGRVRRDAPARAVTLDVPGLTPGTYVATWWDTVRGAVVEERLHEHRGGPLRIGPVSLGTDVAVAVRRVPPPGK